MIRVVDHQKVELNDEEFQYYSELIQQLSEDEFKGLLVTDSKGMITMIKPTKPVSWLVLHFLQQVQINQHLRENDQQIGQLQLEVKQLRDQLATQGKTVARISARTDTIGPIK
jgi:hypothetical protein